MMFLLDLIIDFFLPDSENEKRKYEQQLMKDYSAKKAKEHPKTTRLSD
ncbi:hypothetical protein [Macrococcus animalis]